MIRMIAFHFLDWLGGSEGLRGSSTEEIHEGAFLLHFGGKLRIKLRMLNQIMSIILWLFIITIIHHKIYE